MHCTPPTITPTHPPTNSLTHIPALQAIKLFNELASSDALRMDYKLQPGDIQVLSNHTQLHSRTAFVDWEVSAQHSRPSGRG